MLRPIALGQLLDRRELLAAASARAPTEWASVALPQNPKIQKGFGDQLPAWIEPILSYFTRLR